MSLWNRTGNTAPASSGARGILGGGARGPAPEPEQQRMANPNPGRQAFEDVTALNQMGIGPTGSNTMLQRGIADNARIFDAVSAAQQGQMNPAAPTPVNPLRSGAASGGMGIRGSVGGGGMGVRTPSYSSGGIGVRPSAPPPTPPPSPDSFSPHMQQVLRGTQAGEAAMAGLREQLGVDQPTALPTAFTEIPNMPLTPSLQARADREAARAAPADSATTKRSRAPAGGGEQVARGRGRGRGMSKREERSQSMRKLLEQRAADKMRAQAQAVYAPPPALPPEMRDKSFVPSYTRAPAAPAAPFVRPG